MMDKLKKTAVLLGGVMLILLIIVWDIKHNMKPIDVQPETDTETEVVIEEPEKTPEVQADYDSVFHYTNWYESGRLSLIDVGARLRLQF